MGNPKAALPLAGRALIEYPLAAMRAASLDAVVIAKPDSRLPELDVPVWEEAAEPTHPLAGIVAALERAARPVVVCACDMPFVAPELLAHLAALDVPLAVPRLGGGWLHPLLARYEPSLLDALRDALDARRSMHATIEGLGPLVLSESNLSEFGDPQRLLFNVNTPDDLERAEQMLPIA